MKPLLKFWRCNDCGLELRDILLPVHHICGGKKVIKFGRDDPCIHFGEFIGEVISCGSCSKKTAAYECEIFLRCFPYVAPSGMACCEKCSEYVADVPNDEEHESVTMNGKKIRGRLLKPLDRRDNEASILVESVLWGERIASGARIFAKNVFEWDGSQGAIASAEWNEQDQRWEMAQLSVPAELMDALTQAAAVEETNP